MKRIRRLFVVLTVVLAVNVPVIASAETCVELSKYGWHEDVCLGPGPLDD